MNVRVNVNYTIYDGVEIVFKAPCNASEVTGLILYYPGDTGIVSSVFTFADAHTNDLGNIDHLFLAGAVVKVILDTETNMAFVQNAATNGYLENKFAVIGGGSGGSGANTLRVTYDAERTTSHSAEQIHAHVQNGGNVVLDKGGFYVALSSSDVGSAYFSYTDDEHINTVYEIYGNTLVEIEREYVPRTFFDEKIGDISAALDELHAYAEALKGGDAV